MKDDSVDGLRDAMAERGLFADICDVVWVDPPRGTLWGALWRPRRALVRAALNNEPHDIFLVRARTTLGGKVLGLADVHNLTRTPTADEGVPVVHGERAVFSTTVDVVPTNVFAFDLAGDFDPDAEPLSRTAKWQSALTNLQETGQEQGVGRRGWTFDPSPSSVELAFTADKVSIVADRHTIVLPPTGVEPLEGGAWIRPHRTGRSRPGNLVTWAVDRARALPWFGDTRMQELKATVFTLFDYLERHIRRWGRDASEKEIAADLGVLAHAKPVLETDPETGWPPPPMKPFVVPPLAGEGQWVPLDQDPFIQTNPGAPPAFFTSFIRTDRERAYARIYVTVWDPRQVAMHMMAGTVEPVGATGEAGPGLIPRTPEVLGRLVAAMNGGFQAMHGEFGMMGDGVVYLPPKPFAATVAELRDGSTGFGEWPREPDIPDDILSYRQNMTALVKNEKFNPYGRTWWGGTPPDQADKVHTVRTGICLTRENFIAYFYGAELGPEALAQGMVQARCKFGVHLDMNVGHTGLEFYRVEPAAQLPPLSRPLLSDCEAEGPVPGMDGWRFRGRRMIRGMPLMNFPRYIHREARDFFYLTLRHVLPGPDIPGVGASEARWETRGLPQHGFPFALATARIHPDPEDRGLEVRLVKVDPRTVRAAGSLGSDDASPTVLTFSNIIRSREGRPTLWLGNGAFTISTDPPEHAVELFAGMSSSESLTSRQPAAVGITDDGGMLVYAEAFEDEPTDGATPSPSTAKRASTLDGLLARLGCSSRMLLPHSLKAALGGTLGLDGLPRDTLDAAQVRFVRGEAPAAHSMFDDTPIVPKSVWEPLQSLRIRYFKKPKQAAATNRAASSGAASSAGDPGSSEVGSTSSNDGDGPKAAHASEGARAAHDRPSSGE